MILNPIARFPLNAARIQNTLHSVQETTTCIHPTWILSASECRDPLFCLKPDGTGT